MIEAENINKTFNDTVALDNISFSIDNSELFGFIGPDGAGKTTLFRLITTLLIPDKGSIKVMGLDTIKEYKELRKHIGYMPGRFSLYHDFPGNIREKINDISFSGGEQPQHDQKTENTKIQERSIRFSQRKKAKMIQRHNENTAE